MKREDSKNTDGSELHQKVKRRVKPETIDIEKITEVEVHKLAHELQKFQIELDMQNEELRKSQQEFEDSRDRISKFYDFAPVGYLTISEDSIILEANLTCASLLGIERKSLISKSLEQFIEREDQDIYYLLRKKVYKTKERTTCELRMVRTNGAQFHVHLECEVVQDKGEDSPRYMTILSDITDRKKREETLKARNRQQEVLSYLGEKALLSKDLIDLMNEVVKCVSETLNNEYCKILELLPEKESMLLRTGVGWNEGLVGHAVVPTGIDSQAGYTLYSNKPVIVENLKTDARFSGPKLLHDHFVVSGMSVIIYGQDGPWGVLGTHTKRHITYNKNDINFLQSVANLLSYAIVRKLAEQEKINIATLLSNVVNSTPDLIFAKDLKLRTIMCNESFAQTVKKKPVEIIGKTDIELGWNDTLIHGNLKLGIGGSPNDDLQVLKGKVIHNPSDTVYVENKIRIFDTHKFPLRNEDGQIFGVLGIARDFTERERTTAELLRLTKILEMTSDLVSTATVDFKITYMNNSGRKMLGWKNNSRKIIKDAHPEWALRKIMDEGIPAAIKSGVWEGETAIINNCKGEIPVSQVIMSHKSPDGKVEYLSTIIRDISQQKQIEKTLQNSEECYRSLINDVLDTSNVGIFLLDTEFRIIWINKSMESFFGLKRNEVVGSDKRALIRDKIHHFIQDGEHFKKRLLKTYDENTCIEHFVCHVLPDSNRKERWLEHWSKPIVSGFYSGGRVEQYTDITKRKQAEVALLHSEKMKSIGTMASGVAHEFNNILGIISGKAELASELVRGNEELKKSLCTIYRVANDGATIVKRMFDFTHLEADASEYVNVDLAEVIKETVDYTEPRWKNIAQSNGLAYHIDMEELRENQIIQGNPSELREVFLNIVNNAIDAMPEGGILSFRSWRNSESVCISIRDTGSGMSVEVQRKIFDPFFTTKRPKGTGLGMSMTYGIVARHNGMITLDSELGKGSTFTLKFPITNETAPLDVASKPSQNNKTETLSVLVVDDEEEMCELLRDFFTRDGHKTKITNSGSEALTLLSKEDFDLLLCDLTMPNVSGRDIIYSLDTMRKRPKVFIITGYNYNMKNVKSEELNADRVFTKPFQLSELRREISNVFKSGQRGENPNESEIENNSF